MQLLHRALHPWPGKEPPHCVHPAGSEDALGSGEAEPLPLLSQAMGEGLVLSEGVFSGTFDECTTFVCRDEVTIGFHQWLFDSPCDALSQIGKGRLLLETALGSKSRAMAACSVAILTGLWWFLSVYLCRG